MSPIVLITGANRGLGFSNAQVFADRAPDHELVLAARSVDKAEIAIEELRKVGVQSKLFPIALDITDDASIKDAVKVVEERYGKLDVLINNAAVGILSDPGEIDILRESYTKSFNTNVSGVAVTISAFLPLLKRSSDPRVINVSSSQGSIERLLASGKPSTSMSYCSSKAALNILTVEYQKLNPDVVFHSVCPGFCKTGLNRFQGPRDPINGAVVSVELSVAPKGKYKSGFWEMGDGATGCSPIPW